MPRKIVIVGANAAGVDAAVAARKTDREAEIMLLTKDDVGAYSRCGLPFVLWGQIPAFENLVVYPANFYRMMRFDLKLGTTATEIDTKARTVTAETKDGKQQILEYDSLILATGGQPFRLPIEGIDKEGVFTLHTLKDGQRVAAAMKEAKSAVVIGSGLVGLETTEAFVEKGVKVIIVEMLPWILPKLLDKDFAGEVQKQFERKGVTCILEKSAGAILGDTKARAISVGGEEIATDIIINAAGVRPNVELAKKAGIAIGDTGGIRTNIRMQTSVDNAYAAGDCAETTNMITHRPALPLLGSTAVREGKVAGINAAGGYAVFPGTLSAWVSRMLDLEVGAVGLTEFWAQRSGLDIVAGKITAKTRAAYYPGGSPLRVKVIVEKETKRIVGGQIVGGEEVTQRINALSLAIQNRMSVYELSKADTCYAPSVCETWEPIVLAAELAIRSL